jgi:hypothetical protein
MSKKSEFIPVYFLNPPIDRFFEKNIKPTIITRLMRVAKICLPVQSRRVPKPLPFNLGIIGRAFGVSTDADNCFEAGFSSHRCTRSSSHSAETSALLSPPFNIRSFSSLDSRVSCLILFS